MKKTILSIAVLAAISLGTLAFKNTDAKAGSRKVILEVTNEVRNFEEWKKGFDSDKPQRDKAGLKVIGVYSSIENSKMVTVIAEVPSVEAASNFISDPNLKTSMEKAGVISKPEIKVLLQQD